MLLYFTQKLFAFIAGVFRFEQKAMRHKSMPKLWHKLLLNFQQKICFFCLLHKRLGSSTLVPKYHIEVDLMEITSTKVFFFAAAKLVSISFFLHLRVFCCAASESKIRTLGQAAAAWMKPGEKINVELRMKVKSMLFACFPLFLL